MKDVRRLIRSDSGFPSLLAAIPSAPLVLYCRGSLECLKDPSVAIVGTRHPTPYGDRAARMLAEGLAGLGITTVSGLARGIDTAVHEASLKGGAKTIAVMGTGMDQIYPPENEKLAERISVNGVVVTEFRDGTPPLAACFPQRNRIISGLSLGTVVIEARERSGALITARFAAEQGKEVFAVPGPITSKASAGPNRLIQQGAKLVEDVEDILEEISAFHSKIKPPPANPKSEDLFSLLTSEEQELLNLLSDQPVGIDGILVKFGKGPGRIHESLLNLELKGAIKSLPGKRYVRNH